MPSVGRIVRYTSKTGNYELAAVVTATRESLWAPGVERGDVPPISSDTHVHLRVFTPGALEAYQEFDVPFDADGAPGTWRWPTIRTRDRRATDKLAVLCAVLSLMAVLVTSFVAFTVLEQQGELETTNQQTEQAVCSIVSYAETQAENIRTANPGQLSDTATELDDLAGAMRATGIRCPAAE